MEEDSEQRRKRLKEMRQQADLAEVSHGGVQGSGEPGFLSNPLIEAPSTGLLPDKSNASTRFDYYTDPMSAFSSNKRSNANNIQSSQGYFPPPNIGGFPMPQFPSTHPGSTNPQMTHPPGQVLPAAYRHPVWNGPRGPAPYNFPFRPSGGGTYPSPRFEPQSSPVYNYRPGYSPNPSSGYTNTPRPSRGRGRGFFQNARSPVSGRGSGQGQSSRGHWSNEDRPIGPERFYKSSMIEDPWKCLKPGIWKAVSASFYIAPTPENSQSRTSKSVSTKRECSSAAPVKFSSEPSLAEYLAAAFNEAAPESVDKE